MNSNIHQNPKPCTDPGKRVLEFELPGLEIGIAQYKEGPTGCTVFHFPKPAMFAADEVLNDKLKEVELGVVASELAWDAVLQSFD